MEEVADDSSKLQASVAMSERGEVERDQTRKIKAT